MAELVPDDDVEIRGGKTAVSEWTFYAGTEVWLGRRYDGTPSLLAVQAPFGVLRCSTSRHREGTAWEHERKAVCDTSVKPIKRSSVHGSTREKFSNGNDYLIAPGLSVRKSDWK